MNARIAVVLSLLITSTAAAAAETAKDLTLWYAQPAEKWEEELPIGSGRMGAMVFGGVGQERIPFNEDTLWTGKPHDYVREGARAHLETLRKGAFANIAADTEEEKALNKLAKEKFLSDPVRQKAFQPFGDLRFTFPGHDNPSDYRRELDIDSALARVSYKVGGVTYRREVFASYPDNAIVVRLSADQPGKLSFAMKMDSPHASHASKAVAKDTINLTGQVQ